MARAGTFTIKELGKAGSANREDGVLSAADRPDFEWTSDARPADPSKGGARACPLAPWPLSGKLRTVRTDYPGAKTPSEQVLGPNHEPFSLSGRWDDRYNYPGFAVEELRRFEELCFRGNLVRIQFQNQVFECLITEWNFEYRRDWYIRYSFTVSVHDRPGATSLSDRSPKTIISPTEWAEMLDVTLTSLTEEQERSNALLVATDVREQAAANLDALDVSTRALNDTIDQREIGVFDAAVGSSPFGRLATQFRTISSAAFNTALALAEVRSDLDLSAKTALNVLNFEVYTRSLKFAARIAMGHAREGAADMQERDDPSATRLYRPQAGEHLMSISRRFYGTPHAWHLIAERNKLVDSVLTGDELLIIPERGRG